MKTELGGNNRTKKEKRHRSAGEARATRRTETGKPVVDPWRVICIADHEEPQSGERAKCRTAR